MTLYFKNVLTDLAAGDRQRSEGGEQSCKVCFPICAGLQFHERRISYRYELTLELLPENCDLHKNITLH